MEINECLQKVQNSIRLPGLICALTRNTDDFTSFTGHAVLKKVIIFRLILRTVHLKPWVKIGKGLGRSLGPIYALNPDDHPSFTGHAVQKMSAYA